MVTTALGPAADDGEEVTVLDAGEDWRMGWHPAGDPPDGQPHGSTAFCVTGDGEVVLISSYRDRWTWPGGRPEGGEPWEDTLRRELMEEACATVDDARMLGFVRSRCVVGPCEGRVLVRSIWRADVTLHPWDPQFEIPFRKVVPAAELGQHLWMENGAGPIYSRAAREAGIA